MKIEVWSDVVCPFCYIGKRHYEKALAQFANEQDVELEWKSYQLDPTIPTDLDGKQSTREYLAASKGLDMSEVHEMTAAVSEMAEKAGLKFNFDKAVAANTFKAHRVIQMAKTKGHGDAIEENLFRAHFIEGLDVGSEKTLTQIAERSGLTEENVKEALTNDDFSGLVNQDIQEAGSIGVRGVPFFVFNRKYAISGAQPVDTFLKTLEKSFEEWRKENPVIQLEVSEGPSCAPDGTCN